MKIDVLTIFPEIFTPVKAGVAGKAFGSGIAELRMHDLRDFADDARGTVDDRPYGGGPGMIMKVEPICRAVEALSARCGSSGGGKIIVTSPQGQQFTQEKATLLSREKHIIIICGRYEGIDERAVELLGAEEISIGDYILCGGELPAMVIIESVVRLLPGTLGAADSVKEESFIDSLLEYPHYTRPPEFRGARVPRVLLSGNHEEVKKWRRTQSLKRTIEKRGAAPPGRGRPAGDENPGQ